MMEIPVFDKEEEECKNLDEQWIYNIKYMGIRQEVAFKEKSEIFKRLAEVANVATLTPEQRYHYEADVKNGRAYQDGEAQGMAKGMAQGEMKERTNSIRMMLSFGLTPEQIAEKYGMTVEEVLILAASN